MSCNNDDLLRSLSVNDQVAYVQHHSNQLKEGVLELGNTVQEKIDVCLQNLEQEIINNQSKQHVGVGRELKILEYKNLTKKIAELNKVKKNIVNLSKKLKNSTPDEVIHASKSCQDNFKQVQSSFAAFLKEDEYKNIVNLSKTLNTKTKFVITKIQLINKNTLLRYNKLTESQQNKIKHFASTSFKDIKQIIKDDKSLKSIESNINFIKLLKDLDIEIGCSKEKAIALLNKINSKKTQYGTKYFNELKAQLEILNKFETVSTLSISEGNLVQSAIANIDKIAQEFEVFDSQYKKAKRTLELTHEFDDSYFNKLDNAHTLVELIKIAEEIENKYSKFQDPNKVLLNLENSIKENAQLIMSKIPENERYIFFDNQLKLVSRFKDIEKRVTKNLSTLPDTINHECMQLHLDIENLRARIQIHLLINEKRDLFEKMKQHFSNIEQELMKEWIQNQKNNICPLILKKQGEFLHEFRQKRINLNDNFIERMNQAMIVKDIKKAREINQAYEQYNKEAEVLNKFYLVCKSQLEKECQNIDDKYNQANNLVIFAKEIYKDQEKELNLLNQEIQKASSISELEIIINKILKHFPKAEPAIQNFLEKITLFNFNVILQDRINLLEKKFNDTETKLTNKVQEGKIDAQIAQLQLLKKRRKDLFDELEKNLKTKDTKQAWEKYFKDAEDLLLHFNQE